MSESELLLSEQVYIAIYARTGKWKVKKLSKHVIEIGIEERKKHKRGESCMGCEYARYELWIIPSS